MKDREMILLLMKELIKVKEEENKILDEIWEIVRNKERKPKK